MKKFLPLLFIIILLMSSCKNTNDIDSIRNKYKDMKSYSAVAEITIHGKKTTSAYKVLQYYEDTGLLRIETLEPDFLKGKVLIYNGVKWKIYNPIINETFEITKLRDNDELIHLGVIPKSIIISDKSLSESINKMGKEYIRINGDIPRASDYRNKVNIYINKKDNYPEFMEILDRDNKVIVEIKYSQFEYNREIKKSLFN